MNFPAHIFKKYDIRGLVDTEITDDLAEKIGVAYADLRQSEVGSDKSLTITVGRDMRDSSIGYQKSLMKGLVSRGAKVIDIGLVSTPAFYFSVGHLKADGGIMVSASHNPAEYNGFKMTRERAVPISGDTGIAQISEMVELGIREPDSAKATTGTQETLLREDASDGQAGIRGQGRIETFEGIPALSARAEFDHAGGDPIKKMKIVADSANGMGAQYLDELFNMIDADVTRMYWELDGNFPNHEADPFKLENTEALRKKVVEVGADIGIATDGDGDRIFFIDNTGKRVTPAIVRGLLSQIALREHSGATICYDIRPGRITKDMILESGGVPCVTRVGHSLIKEKMRKENAVFGGESSGHFYYKFETGTYDGPLTVATQMLQEITRRNESLADITSPYDKYAHSGEINFKVEDKDGVMHKLKERFKDGELNELDGITIEYDDFWFNVRTSNTESKLRLNLEAVDEATMEARRDEVVAFIKENA
jgi:phosphomannomutase